jgi:hypothetical protein
MKMIPNEGCFGKPGKNPTLNLDVSEYVRQRRMPSTAFSGALFVGKSGYSEDSGSGNEKGRPKPPDPKSLLKQRMFARDAGISI